MKQVDPRSAHEIISQHMLRKGEVVPVVLDLDRSLGNYIIDASTGKRYLDCIGYVASNPVGHNHPGLHEPEFEKKLLRAARAKPSNSDFDTVEMAEFVQAVSTLAMPTEMRHLFVVEGGSVAIENAIKAAFDWKVRKNFARGLTEERGHQIIHFREAFHGRTGYSVSMTNTTDPRKIKFFPKFDWPRVTTPKLRFPLNDENIRQTIALEQQAEAEIRQAFQQYDGDIAAIILEPIQAEGGDNHFRTEFHQLLRRLADEFEALLIYDEVQTGVGLTGKMWAYEHYSITPDILVFGKKMQVCGFFAGPRLEENAQHVFAEPSRINSTWGGGLVDMVRVSRFLEIIAEERLVENAATVGLELQAGLEELMVRHPAIFSNARGRGLMTAVDVASSAQVGAFMQGAFERGLVFLKCGERSLRFRPSLTFSTAEVGELIGILDDTAKHLA